jgi:peptide/nickel transport system substrate-binding protein
MESRSIRQWRRWAKGSSRLLVCIAAIAAVAAAGLSVVACGGGATTKGQSPSVLNLVNAWEYAGGGGWDPRAAGSNQVCYMANMYETLVRINPLGSAEPVAPLLATSWEVSKDSLVWTFHLRQGVKFQDGEPCNAAAVKYSIESTKKLNQGSAYILDAIKSVQVVDDLTVKFVLNNPAPLDRILAAEYAAYIFSPATKGKPTGWWAGKSFGTGPYEIASYTAGVSYTYKAFNDYWGGWNDSQYREVVVRVVPEALTQQQLLESDQGEFAYQVDADTVKSVPKSLTVVTSPTFYQFNIDLNTARKPLDDVRVRQALAWALPYPDILTLGVNGMGSLSVGPIPATLWPHDAACPTYSYDVAKAKALLVEAGYPGGQGIHPLKLTYFSENTPAANAAPLVKQAWEALGLKVQVQPLLTSQLEATATGPAGQRQDAMIDRQWPSFPDGYDMLWYQWHSQEPVGYNWSYWSSPETDKLMDDAFALESTDVQKAKALYDQCQVLIVGQVPSIPLFDMSAVYLRTSNIELGAGALNENYPMVLFWDKVVPASGG